MISKQWALSGCIAGGLAVIAMVATPVAGQSKKQNQQGQSSSKQQQNSAKQRQGSSRPTEQLQRLQQTRERQVERQKAAETRRAAQPQQPVQVQPKPQQQQQQARPQQPPQQPPQQQQPKLQANPAVPPPKPGQPVIQQLPQPKVVVPAQPPAGVARPGQAAGPGAGQAAQQQALDALRQQQIDAKQQQRRLQQQQQPQWPQQAGRPAGVAGGAPPSPAGRGGNPKPVIPVAPAVANAKLKAQPVLAVGSPTARGGYHTTAMTSRRIANLAQQLRAKYKPPVFPKISLAPPNLGPPKYPYYPKYPSYPNYPKHHIDRTSIYYQYFVIVIWSAYAFEMPGGVGCNCLLRIEREGPEDFSLQYVPRPDNSGTETDAVVVYPDPTVLARPAVDSPTLDSPAVDAVQSARVRAAIVVPMPPDQQRDSPNSAAATLGGLGGAAFEACTAAPGAKSPADAGSPAGTDDGTKADPVHFMLETGGHQAPIRSMVFTAGGKCLLTGGDDKVIRIWSLAQGRSDRVLRGEIDAGAKGRIHALALSPDGTLLAAGGSMEAEPGIHAIRLYDLRTGAIVDLLIGHTDVVRTLAFSADGKRLLSGGLDNIAVLWNIETRAPLQVFDGHTGGIVAAAFLPDGQRVATASLDGIARIWNPDDGAVLATLAGHGAPLAALVVRAADGAIVTAAQDGAIKLWKGDGRFERDIAQVEFSPGALVLSPAADAAVITCADRCRRNFAQVVISIASGQSIARYSGHDGFVFAAAVSAEGQIATAGGTRNEVHVWSTTEDKATLVLKGLGRTVSATGFYSDSRTIAWSYTFEAITHLKRGPMEFSLDLPMGVSHPSEPLPFDKEAAPGFVHSIDRTGDLGIESGPSAQAGGGGRGGGGSGGGGGGSSASGPRSAVVRILRNGAGIATIAPTGTPDPSFAYRTFGVLPSGEHVIAGGDNGLLETYDLTGQKAVGYVGHTGSVWTQTPSPDGRLLVSGASDQTVKLWNLATGELIVTLFQATDGEWVMWTPQGYYTGSAGAGELIGWQVDRGPDKASDYVRAQQFQGHFNRPDIVARAIVLATAQDAVTELAPQHVTPEEILRQGLPPVVAKLSGAPETTGGRGIIVVGLKENPLPVEALDVWVGDRKVTTRPAPLPANLNREPGVQYLALDVPLFQGENIIRVAAINEVGASDQSEKRLTIRIKHNGEGALDKRGTLHVLAVGVDKYPSMGPVCSGPGNTCDLSYAGSDAEGFNGTAQSEMSRSHDKVNVTVLVNGKTPQREPTLANIKAALEQLRNRVADNDTVALFFAGHGLNHGGAFYFMPTDSGTPSDTTSGVNALHWGEVQAVINQLGGRKLLFLDACHAANSYYARLGEDARTSRFVAYAAATAAQASQESPDVLHGEFTYALINGLKGKAASQDDAVKIYELAIYLHSEVSKRTNGQQTPEFFPTPGEGNFALVKRP